MASTSNRTMPAACTSVEDVKGALKDSAASQDTIATLQGLLGFQAIPIAGVPPKSTPSAATARKNAPKNTARTVPVQARGLESAIAKDDHPRALTPREKYALATEIVNTGLKVLTEAAKRQSTGAGGSRDEASSDPTPISRRALQPRSGNATPVQPSPEKGKQNAESGIAAPRRSVVERVYDIVPTAECTRMAFAFLRSVDAQKLGVREMPRLQLETGMLAFIGKLISLGLVTMAAKELKHVKHRIEVLLGETPPSSQGRDTTARKKPAQTEKETMASLLQLNVYFGDDTEALNLGSSYVLHSLRVIAQSCKPATVEETVQFIAIERANSPADLLLRLARKEGQVAKAAKQLETLSQTISSLCPRPSSTSDVVAVDTAKNASPQTVLRLQTIALQIRTLWWKMAEHSPDIEKELLEPFLRCAVAFVRRATGCADASTIYGRLREAFEILRPDSTTENEGGALLSIKTLLSQQAERAGDLEMAMNWSKAALELCDEVEQNHAKRLSAVLKHKVLAARTSASNNASLGLGDIEKSLQSKLAGSAADFDALLAGLNAFLSLVTPANSQSDTSMVASPKLVTLAVNFALQYARSYPDRGTDHVKGIINSALRASKSTEDLLSWVSLGGAMVFVRSGVIERVAATAARKPLAEAFAISQDALSLSRICRALVLANARSPGKPIEGIIDDDALAAAQRGALLEIQLDAATQLSTKTKYRASSGTIVSELLRRLNKLYDADVYPLRRSRVALAVLRLQERYPDIVAVDVFADWQAAFELDDKQLFHDESLRPFFDDVRAALQVSQAFVDGSPSFDRLQPALLSWSTLLRPCTTLKDVQDRIEDPSILLQQLGMISSYLSMRGDEQNLLAVLLLLKRLEHLQQSAERCSCLTTFADLAECYLDLGFQDRAERVLSENVAASMVGSAAIRHYLVQAACYLAVGDIEGCARALGKSHDLRENCTPDTVNKDQRRTFEILHAQSWLMHSRYALYSGSPHEALVQGKRSVKILNSIWATVERADGSRQSEVPQHEPETEPSGSGVDNLTKGVSRLQLTPKDDSAHERKSERKKGAAFWQLVPVLTKALMHLSDLYSFHGLFSEANYYSERAVNIGQSVGSDILLTRIRSHRAQLMALAGRMEEAELCLTQDEPTRFPEPSLAAVERLRAMAAIRAKEGSYADALEALQKAQKIAEEMVFPAFVIGLEGLFDPRATAERVTTGPSRSNGDATGSRRAIKAPSTRPAAGARAKQSASKKAQPIAAKDSRTNAVVASSALAKVKAELSLRALFLRVKLGHDVGAEVSSLKQFVNAGPRGLRTEVVQHLHLMAQANAALEADVTMNVLIESPLALPSFVSANDVPSSAARNHTAEKSSESSRTATRSKKPGPRPKQADSNRIVATLQTARECLLQEADAEPLSGSTAQMHLDNSLRAHNIMLLSAINPQQQEDTLRRCLGIDQPRTAALQYERQVVIADKATSDSSEPLSWPTLSERNHQTASLPQDFQAEYIDIIPKPWTAVSICLSEDASELYIARYQREQEPFILRLPFSRHKPEDVDEEEAFDYAKGKAELQEIIELSNYTCHSSKNLDVKGAKDTWWSDREALDRRMHELLINMEDIWFGGFKAIFAQALVNQDLLPRFRKSLEDILDRYLPSRQTAKWKTTKLALSDKVLELFVGLGDDQDGVIDLDEPLADLLYFVVDMLQFSGERNAYDEIDFDGMAVDVLDALRSYHEAIESNNISARHLILVLDRRLQAFPWENMPCLQGESVSRVGSMQSLRECVLAMRASRSKLTERLPAEGEGCHVVERTKGSYILNPSSDLKATQTMLSPALQTLRNSSDQPWTSLVNEAPDEQRFSTTLRDSSILLYFGHGAGSQYIRPRAIKRLNSCSEVVWLMGCSSGAVTDNGDLEPSAVPHAYLLAATADSSQPPCFEAAAKESQKCMAVLATLWDVTDKDIDRFSLAVGEEWGLWPTSEQAKLPKKTPKKRGARQVVAPSTPQQAPKTPRTPKVRKTPAAKTPGWARSRDGGGDGVKKSLVQAVARSREACYLRYLNGAAAVVYGVPVYLGD